MSHSTHPGIELRPLVADDEPFLFDLYRANTAVTFAALDLTAERLDGLLRTQLTARENQYRAQYPSADFDVVLHNAERIGNLYAQRGPDVFVLIDIALSPEFRNQGIGSNLVKALIDVASEANKPLLAHVLLNNPAWHLWQRLGFRHVGDNGVYRQIEVPATPSTT